MEKNKELLAPLMGSWAVMITSIWAAIMTAAGTSSVASAMSLDWAGSYRFEYLQVDRPSLSDNRQQKQYMLHYLNLSPKIIAADGFNIVGSFDVLANDQYPDSQLGQPLGIGNKRTGSPQSSSNTVNSMNQKTTNLMVRQLYFNMNNEYGALLIGRAPFHFGLGMTYNAGKGSFDHWGTVQDVLAYKFLIGNLAITPMLGRVYDADLGPGGDVTDMIWNFEYYNSETDSTFGVAHRTRKAEKDFNDAPLAFYAPGGTLTSGWSTQHVNIVFGRGFEPLDFKFEVGFENGSTGLTTSAGEDVKLGGFAVVSQLNFKSLSAWQWGLWGGVVSGDNPSTSTYEGYLLHRNYDLGFLLFNHPMGGFDIFRTGAQRNCKVGGSCSKTNLYALNETADEETVSNVMYLSPRFSYKLSDRWNWRSMLTVAQLQNNSSEINGNEVEKYVGTEWDLALEYKPQEKLIWSNEIGIFFPGAAWKEGSVGRDMLINYGMQSRISIKF